MKRLDDRSLRHLNTFGVEARAERVIQLDRPEDLACLEHTPFDDGRDIILGGGSNVLFAGDIAGTVYLNRMLGREILDDDGDNVLVEAMAGEQWHDFVQWTLDQGLNGLENLSLIPGLVGAAPMQNIGAYGVEVSSLLDSVAAFDLLTGQLVRLPADECALRYRDSRFKSGEPGRFIILSCRFRLSRRPQLNIQYAGLADELAAMGVDEPSARDVSNAVVRIRRRKLPDPAKLGNAGSFFKNPVVEASHAEDLKKNFPSMPLYPAHDSKAKLSAAWLIEQCGWKGHRSGDAGISEDHALVLVNHGKATGLQLLDLARRIEQSVFERFGLHLEHEPRIIGKTF